MCVCVFVYVCVCVSLPLSLSVRVCVCVCVFMHMWVRLTVLYEFDTGQNRCAMTHSYLFTRGTTHMHIHVCTYASCATRMCKMSHGTPRMSHGTPRMSHGTPRISLFCLMRCMSHVTCTHVVYVHTRTHTHSCEPWHTQNKPLLPHAAHECVFVRVCHT